MQIEREEISGVPNGTQLLEWTVQQKCADYTKEFSFLQKSNNSSKNVDPRQRQTKWK